MSKKIILEIYLFFKDIFLFVSYSHKIPLSFIFNKLPYQKLRILIDFFLVKKYKKKFINKFSNTKKDIFKKGNIEGIILNQSFFTDDKIDNIKNICNELIKNHKKHKISIDDGGVLEQNSESFSKYYYLPRFNHNLSIEVSKLYELLYSNDDLMNQMSFFSGINFKKNDISIHISKVKGALLSDDWHSDCFGHTSKAFLYLHNIEKNNSPFCYLKKSHANKNLKMLHETNNSQYILNTTKNKNLHSDDIWNKLKNSTYKEEIFNQSEKLECSFPKSTLIVCDTSGFHKKGFSDGTKERFMIGFISKRGTILDKFKSAFF